MQSIDLSELVEKVCGDAEVIAHEIGDVVVAYVNGVAHDMVRGDPARIRQLFLVLLDNAVRYSKSKGAVKVGSAAHDGEVKVRVTDHGIGIPPEESSKASSSASAAAAELRTMNAEGLGLGLPVAKAIVEAHKGRIEMASRLGEGTTVTIALRHSRTEATA